MLRTTAAPRLRTNPKPAHPSSGALRPDARRGAWPPQGPCENSRFAQETFVMDIERVNAIGSLLADLSARTEQLRGYL
jgi:hypothetical protein